MVKGEEETHVTTTGVGLFSGEIAFFRFSSAMPQYMRYALHYITDVMQTLLLCGERVLVRQHSIVHSMD